MNVEAFFLQDHLKQTPSYLTEWSECNDFKKSSIPETRVHRLTAGDFSFLPPLPQKQDITTQSPKINTVHPSFLQDYISLESHQYR